MKLNKQNIVKNALMSNPDIDAICITSDGSTFDAKNKSFADSHSQRFDNKSIDVFGKTEQFKNDNKNLFFDGSKWSFELISMDDQNDVDLNDLKVDELKQMANELDGFKSSMKKSELIKLITNAKK